MDVIGYIMTQSRTETVIIRNCLREGRPLPKAIQDAPELSPEHQFYFTAFDDLTTCRLYEMGPIPFIYVNEYCRSYDLDEDQTADIRYVIGQVDAWLREKWAEDVKRRSKKSK